MTKCIACSNDINDKDIIGINIKLLGKGIKRYYCMDCLADYLCCTTEDLIDKIEEFKEEGCTLFN